MNRTYLSIPVALLAFALDATAQNVTPVVTSQIADFTEYAGAPARSIDLLTVFNDPDMSAGVRMTTVLGTIDIGLFGQQKPLTVANFLSYVDQGRYFLTDPTTHQPASTFFHRSVPGFVIQAGGFIGTVDTANTVIQPTEVLVDPPILNEPGISNKRGTISMARQPDPDSAQSQWFFNLADNGGAPHNLDTAGGGYSVFGRIVGSGLTVIDAIAAVQVFNFGVSGGGAFTALPLRNWNTTSPVLVSNLISIPGIARLSALNFTVTSNNPTVADATLSGTTLLIAGHQTGSATFTVTATDLDGASVAQSFTVNVVAAPGRLVELSTRMQIGSGDNVLIGGFILRGPSPKRLMIRAIGPSTGLSGALADPTLELRDSAGVLLASNDNWGDAPNKQELVDSGIPPTSPSESALLGTVPSDPNFVAYTAIVRGANNTAGIGLVEVYDLDSGPGSTFLNISTRGHVDVDPNALIGGFFLGGTQSKTVLVRAIGPSLADANVQGFLVDPILELRDVNGTVLDSNDDWGSNPDHAAIQATGLAPSKPKESAVLDVLPAGPFTAIVRGANNTTGVGSVEVYQLN